MEALGERLQAAREMVTDSWNSFLVRCSRLRQNRARYFIRCLLLSTPFAVGALLYLMWDNWFPYVNDALQLTNPRPQRVLIWWAHTVPWTLAKIMGDRDLTTSPCPATQPRICSVSKKRDYINASDAVVLSAESVTLKDLPPFRNQIQAWVFFAVGPPKWPPSKDLLQAAAMCNWTMAYREDADIVVPYKTWSPVTGKLNASKLTSLARPKKNKTKSAVWMISECENLQLQYTNVSLLAASRWSGTERFIGTIVKELNVTLISDCGRRLCESRDKCLSLLEDEYYFVIVMESSPCFEHPAQLIYDSFHYDIIPVFFGVGDFQHPLPPRSFIDTSKLRYPVEVIRFLEMITSHSRAYSDYIKARPILAPAAYMCALCKTLHWPPKKSRHDDFLLWWRSRSHCPKFTAAQQPDAAITQSPGVNSSEHF